MAAFRWRPRSFNKRAKAEKIDMNLEPLRELEREWRDNPIPEYQRLSMSGEAIVATHKAYRACADDLSRALAQLDDGWRPIAEAPRDGTTLIVYATHLREPRTAWWESEHGWVIDWHEYDGPQVLRNVTVFRPLPSPPAQSQEPMT